MVTAKPIHVVNVMADPRTEDGAFTATKAENWGESAATVTPQKIMNDKNSNGESDQIHGESKQQIPEAISVIPAILLLPNRNDNLPPTKQPTAPAPIMTNDNSGTLSK